MNNSKETVSYNCWIKIQEPERDSPLIIYFIDKAQFIAELEKLNNEDVEIVAFAYNVSHLYAPGKTPGSAKFCPQPEQTTAKYIV